MCYTHLVERIPLRELRNQASQVVRRARSGERLVITVDGVPAAEIGPLRADGPGTIQELIASGEVIAPHTQAPLRQPAPMRSPTGRSSSDVLRELRER